MLYKATQRTVDIDSGAIFLSPFHSGEFCWTGKRAGYVYNFVVFPCSHNNVSTLSKHRFSTLEPLRIHTDLGRKLFPVGSDGATSVRAMGEEFLQQTDGREIIVVKQLVS